MLNKNELNLVNEIVKALDNECVVTVDNNQITIVELDPQIENSIFNDKVQFIEELRECVKMEYTSRFSSIEKEKALEYIIELNNIKYNHLKNIVLEATKNTTWKNIGKSIELLDNFINLWCYDSLSLNKSQNIKTYRNIIENCDTLVELQETLKDIYYMKQDENVKNNDYVISTIQEVEEDKKLFINECNKHHELYDPEVEQHLNSFKILNRKFMYIA